MNKMNMQKVESLDSIVNKIWDLSEHLRGQIKTDDYHIILFLLALTKDKLITHTTAYSEPSFFRHIENLTESTKYSQIYAVYSKSLEHIPVGKIIDQLLDLDSKFLSENYPVIFDALIYKFISAKGRQSREFILPDEISQLMVDLADLSPKAKVYNPFAGLASFGVKLSNEQHYFGQELNSNTWALGTLRLLAQYDGKNHQLVQADSINDWNPAEEKFDCIISSPPFYVKNFKARSEVYGAINELDLYVLEKAVKDISDDGKTIILVHSAFFVRTGKTHDFLRKTVENDLVEAIISFPTGVLSNTGIPISILIINKDKKEKGKICFVDAAPYLKINRQEKILKREDLLTDYYSHKGNVHIKYISNDSVALNDFNLSVGPYLIEVGKAKKLSNLLSPVSIEFYATEEETNITKLVKVKDLKHDPLDYHLDLGQVMDRDKNDLGFLLSESCLLLTTIGESIRPTYFKFSGESILLSSNILAFKIDESLVDIEYLIHELTSDYVHSQIKHYSLGPSIISKKLLLLIKINVPGLNEQRAKVLGFKEAYVAQKEKELQLQKEILGLKHASSRDLKSVRHTLAQYLNALRSNVSGTYRYLKNHEGEQINLTAVYSKNQNQSLEDHLKSIQKTIDAMSKIMSSLETVNSEAEKQEILKLDDLIMESQLMFKDLDKFVFEDLFIDHASFSGDQGYLHPFIKFTKEDFFQVFSNIISNAVTHGFKDESIRKYTVTTAIINNPSRNEVIMELANNGSPMAKDFTYENLITKGDKTTSSEGSGVGGSDIFSLLSKHNSRLELISDPGAEFPVKYVIHFPVYSFVDKMRNQL
tara:strand:+ start:11711 stop:14170 length:2460 start_codon:yes stop_codon:yes gene_type:complete